MCFSAEASFVVGTALLPAGGYCIVSAIQKRPRLLPLAIVPLVFGIQQLSEGFVWVGLDRNDPALTRSASLVFLFIALAFWPCYFPFMTASMESNILRRRLFTLIAIGAIGWFWILYFPIISGDESVLTTRIVHHSIQYDYSQLSIYHFVPRTVLRIVYFLCVALPLALGSNSLGRTAGFVFGASALVAAIVYDYAFVSVWCFFTAALSAYLCWMFAKIKQVERNDERIAMHSQPKESV